MADAHHAEVLEALLGYLMEPAPPPPWDDLFPPGEHLRARALYFLLHREPGRDVQSLVTDTLERLLRNLNCHTERETIAYQGRIRGKVDWPQSLKSRFTGDYDPTRFVCRDVRRRLDTLENQLLKATVDAVWRCLRSVPESIRQGRCYYPASRRTSHETIDAPLREMDDVLTRLRGHVALRQITMPPRITELHVRKAQTSKSEDYGRVAEVWVRYDESVGSRGWDTITRIGRSVIPLPARLDGAEEAWLRLAATLLRHGSRLGATRTYART